LQEPISLAPLASFRALFGALMFYSTLRFVFNGWVESLYLEPDFLFHWIDSAYLDWLAGPPLYIYFALMALSSLGICFGLFYRASCIIFFLTFSSVELLDKSNYLNHYYFVSLISFLLIFLPADRSFSLRSGAKKTLAARWICWIIPAQIGLVYFFAGLAKLNSDWLLSAQPLTIWLEAKSDLPLIGPLLALDSSAYAFSWMGAIYDLSIPFLLAFSLTRPLAYLAVTAFHLLTAMLFPIGVFPWVMMASSLIFFSASWHQDKQNRIARLLASFFRSSKGLFELRSAKGNSPIKLSRLSSAIIIAFFLLQIMIPLRYLTYDGNIFWNERGYRFSWRVMLMEKAGYISFQVEDLSSGGRNVERVSDYLSPNQEKMMATQPDMILDFVAYLEKLYQDKGLDQISIYADSWVSLNGRGSTRYISPEIDLLQLSKKERIQRSWILNPYENHEQF
jgi:hypothetical protein